MTTYRLMDGLAGRPGNGPSSTVAYTATPFQAGIVFSVLGQMMWLNGYYWWVANTGQDTGPQKFALWNRYSTSQQQVVSAATVTSTGSFTAGAWNLVSLANPVQLAPGGLYVACTGWQPSAGNGFPDVQNQFGSGQPYVNGITNGPLTAWSDATAGGTNNWPGASANYGLAQGLFGTGAAGVNGDPTLNFPAGGSNSANFQMDVLVSDTAPAGYTGSFRLQPNRADISAGNFANDTATNFTLGLQFSLTTACSINNVWFYSPAGVTQLPTWVGVFTAPGGVIVAQNASPSWSGVAGSGWVKASLSGSLAPGTNYKLGITNGAASPAIWNAQSANYWSTGFGANGLTAGPISAPNNASALSPGQESYNVGASPAYPNTNAGPFEYGLDLELTPSAQGAASLITQVPPPHLVRSALY